VWKGSVPFAFYIFIFVSFLVFVLQGHGKKAMTHTCLLAGRRRWLAVLAVLVVTLCQGSVASDLNRDGLLDSLMAGQRFRMRDGSVATIEAIEGNTRAATSLGTHSTSGSRQQLKAKHLSRNGIQTGYAREVRRAGKTADGGSTSVIANRNFMSIMEDENGNTIPNENTLHAERHLAKAEQAIKRNAMASGAAPREFHTKPGPSQTPPVTPVTGSLSGSASAGSQFGEAAEASAAANATSAAESAEEAAAAAAATENAESPQESAAVTPVTPRFKSQRADEEQQLEQEAGRINALAEVNEALDDARRTNERNVAHDAMMTRRRVRHH